MMNDERFVEDIITSFILNTCRLCPQFSEPAVQAVVECSSSLSSPLGLPNDPEVDLIPLTTGSVAEFYVEPMLPHIGDVDIMFYQNNMLAIPRGHPPPTQLPDEFHNYVKVLEIIDSHLPGYVYLEFRYLLTECVDDGKYNAVEYDRGKYWSKGYDLLIRHDESVHGPAIMVVQQGRMLSCDNVYCVRCLVWPSQAADWPKRHRNYGWPDSATVDRVVTNGCDMVCVAHRQCRQHKRMGRRQWRLSFSRAEIVLINSWTPVQQIVYHMLRVFMKTERLTESIDNSETGTLSNYHIKTLMLWACEMKHRIWWTDDLSLVRICVELLHELAVWLTEPRCPHYFINNCNLIDDSFNLETIPRQLLSISKSWFSSWLVNNYIRRCSQLCPQHVSRLTDDVSTSAKLQNGILAIVEWRQNTTQTEKWLTLCLARYNIVSTVSRYSVTVHSVHCWFTELGKISTSLPVYFLSVAHLHIALKTSKNGLNDWLMDVLSVLVGQSIVPRRYSSRRNSVLLLSKAVNLMKAIGNRPKSRSTVQLIEIELSKAYLYRALSWVDSDSDSTYCLVNVYLAVLYYTTGQYQTAIDHCTLVMRSHDHSQCSSHVVQGESIPKTDDDVDIVLGLAVFYQHVRMAALNQQQSQYVTVFTTELFAHYLHIKCLSVTKYQQPSDTANSQSSTDDVQSYVKYITDMQQLFVADLLLWKLVNAFDGHKFVPHKQHCGRHQCPRKYQSEVNTSNLVELLQKSAVEYMTTFLQMEVIDINSLVMIVTTDFEALYVYKHNDYQQCLQLSTQNVQTLLCAGSIGEGVSTFPEFIQLLDDDVVSLTALALIAYPECRTETKNVDVAISQLALSLYLMTQCQLNLRHSVTSLAQTLHYVKVAHRRHPVEYTLDRLVLKMIAHKAVTYITTMMNKVTTHNSP